jgi:hypothetical protein
MKRARTAEEQEDMAEGQVGMAEEQGGMAEELKDRTWLDI